MPYRLLLKGAILGGCGTLMASHLGFLQALTHHDLLRHVTHYVGISAGSVIGFLFTLGLSIETIYKDIIAYDLLHLIQQENPLKNLMTQCGIFNLSIMGQRVQSLLEAHGLDAQMTFAQHFALTKKTFCVIATDADTMTPLYADHQTCANVSVLDMVLGSCCIPFAFGTRPHPVSQKMMIDGVLSDAEPFAHMQQKYDLRPFEITAHLIKLTSFVPASNPMTLFSNIFNSFFTKPGSKKGKEAILIVRTPLEMYSAMDIRYKEEHHYAFFQRALLETLHQLSLVNQKPFFTPPLDKIRFRPSLESVS